MSFLFVTACGRTALPAGLNAHTNDGTKDAGDITAPNEDAGTQDASTSVELDAGPLCDQPGQPLCPCTTGFERDGAGNCVDIDECTFGSSGCAHVCTNEIGSFTCSCYDDSFELYDGTGCEPVFNEPQRIREPRTDQISDLDIAGNHDGVVLVTWIESQKIGFGGTLHMRSFDSAYGWDLTDYVLPVSEDTFRPRVAVDEFGNGIVLWQSWHTDHWVTNTSRFSPGVGFSDVLSVSADEAAWNAWGDVAMLNSGDAVTVWAREDAAGTVIRTGVQHDGGIWDQRKTLVELGDTEVFDVNVVGNTVNVPAVLSELSPCA